MKKLTLVVIATILVWGASLAFAQHRTDGDAVNGYYPPSYSGETFTGKLASVDDTAQSINLVYENGNKTENFTGSFQKPCDVPTKNGQPMRVLDLRVGTNLTAYYIASTHKVGGEKRTQNLIFAIMFNTFPDRTVPDSNKKVYYCPGGQYLQFRGHQ